MNNPARIGEAQEVLPLRPPRSALSGDDTVSIRKTKPTLLPKSFVASPFYQRWIEPIGRQPA